MDLALEHMVLRPFKALPQPPRRVLMAVSGGLDSMVMAAILAKWRKGLGLELAVAHIHHGPTDKKRQATYRAKTQGFVRQWAELHSLPFLTNEDPPKRALNNEAELREFRLSHLRVWRSQFDAVAFAHHQDDLLETRILRLIRGSGPQGLRAMHFYQRGVLRPLLALSRAGIQLYAEVQNLKWLEDPSNRTNYALRNWLRREWLPALEIRCPGALRRLAQSLELMAPQSEELLFAPYVGLRRDLLQKVSREQRQQLIASYLHSLGAKNYGRTHIDEILKRLDTRRKSLSFEMVGLRIEISADYLWASRV
jgi:tRNA(Ile)-lysidine synthase